MKKILLPAFFLLLFTACEKDFNFIQKPVPPPPPPPEGWSFSKDIFPIFEAASCAKSGCHNAGGISPELTAASAYTSLTGYINKETPAQSIIYLVLTDKNNPDYPYMNGKGGGATVSAESAAKILAWIQEGAKNN